MHKRTLRIFSFLLALLMCFTIFATEKPVSAKIVITEDDYSSIPDLGFEIIDKVPTESVASVGMLKNLCGGALKMLAGRAVEELTAFAIKSDIPVLGDFLYALQTPAQRAAIKQRKMIEEISIKLTEIDASLKKIDDQLNDISDKLDKYATAEDFKTSIQHLNEIASQYKTAWKAYQDLSEATCILAELQEKKDNETDELVIATLETQIETADYNVQIALDSFIAIIEEGGGYKFAADLEDISIRMWNPSNPTSSYLGAYEAYLRERYPFEHQISEKLREAFQSCTNIQVQIFALYRDYYKYKRLQQPDSAAYKAYTEEYFNAVNYALVENLDQISISTGFAEHMLDKPLTEEELKNIREYDKDFIEPENINSSVLIGGQKYDCYKIRDNQDKSYYLILKDFISVDSMVECYKIDYASSNFPDRHIHRPHWMLNSFYTDDYKYTMISDFQQITAIEDWDGDVLSKLRSVSECGLDKLPEQTEYFMLYQNDLHVPITKYSTVYWGMNFVKARATEEKVSINTNEMPEGYDKCLVVYKSVSSVGHFINGTWVVNDRGEVNNKTVIVEDGETLDMTQMSTNPSGVTIYVEGGATVISNPSITLENSMLIYSDNDTGSVKIKNLNIKAKDHQETAFVIQSNNSEAKLQVSFEGKNTFYGLASTMNFEDIYNYHKKGKPVGVSHGIFISKNTQVLFTNINNGTLYAYGAGGGAGICIDGSLKSEKLDIFAEGSQVSMSESYIENSSYWLYSVGSGIGTSLSCIYKFSGSKYTVDDGKQIDYDGEGMFRVDGGNIKAVGKSSALKYRDNVFGNEIYSEDIGGVNIPSKGKYYGTEGEFANATIEAQRAFIGNKYITKNKNNIFINERYIFETYTAGSNGVTTDGISIKVDGNNETSDWMKLSSCGNDKGTWEGSFNGKGTRNIQTVSVKTNSSNHWWPGKISVIQKFAGNEITVYGGRWIGNSENILKPTDNIYELNVKTSDATNSGTNATIKACLRDQNKLTTDFVDLSDIHWDNDAFEKDDDTTFWIYVPDSFGECRQVLFNSDHSGSAAGWKLESFNIKKVLGTTEDKGYYFASGQWFEEARTIAFGKNTGKTGAFYIEVKTANKSLAGTDSNIYLTIFGSAGNTGRINIGTYANSANNFEAGDLNCFRIGYDIEGIGEIQSIEITKDNKGSGPDWYPEYIVVTEKLADGNKEQSFKFMINQWIEDNTYKFESGIKLLKSASRFDFEKLKALEQNEDGSYTIRINRDTQIDKSVFEFIKEKKIKANIVMTNNEKPIYEICFDGSKITDYKSIYLKKGHLLTEGNAILNFVTGITLPAGTTIKVYTENIGFFKNDKLIVMSKDESGKWKDNISAIGKEGTLVFSIEEGKEFLINRFGSALPDVDNSEQVQNPDTNDYTICLAYIVFVMFLIATVLLKRKVLQ